MLDVLVFEPFGDRRAQPSGDDPFDSGVDVERGADDRARKSDDETEDEQVICWKRMMDGKNEPAICIWSLSEKRRKTI